jgi:AhpD family alkylhydroperoxidase
MTYVPEPKRPHPILRLGVWIAERTVKRRLLPARLLAHYPKAAVSSAVMEALVAHREGRIDERLLQLVRLTVSLTSACAFCIDMNGVDRQRNRISERELAALRAIAGGSVPNWPASLSELEILGVRYAHSLSTTPPSPSEVIDEVTAVFTPREIVVLATTAAQVGYWTRLIQGLGVPPAGFSETCQVPPR